VFHGGRKGAEKEAGAKLSTFASSPATDFQPMDRKSSVSSVGSSSFFSTGSSRSSLREVEEEPQTPEAAPSKKEGENGEDDKIHVAVEKDFKLSKANLVWVLKNTPRTKKIVIVHVHVPSQMIPMSKLIAITPLFGALLCFSSLSGSDL
ncbi:hypothetical protein B296_00024043, partial [Ensete ventricosum]